MLFLRVVFMLFLVLLLNACSANHDLASAKVNYAKHDYSRAVENLIVVTKKSNNPEAQYALGYMYYYGLGIAKDQDIARYWIEKAANQHYPPAIKSLASIDKVRAQQYIPFEAKNAALMSHS